MDIIDFFLGGVAATFATVFTNPLEVIKTRMQLQGELSRKGQHVVPYKNIYNALILIVKKDGILSLQKGLAPSLYFQFFLNFFRLGIFNTAQQHGWTKNSDGEESLARNILCGASGGFIGAAFASPFFMLRTHLQSQAATEIAVGHQHAHTGMFSALRDIYRKHGVPGLYRGVAITMPRALLGSGGQIAAFSLTKDYLQQNYEHVLSPTTISFLSGACGGTVMGITMTPPDVIATRLYNQGTDKGGHGLLYKGVIDCFWKTIRAEGIRGLYKGFWPHYLRIGPHSTLVLVFFDEFMLIRKKYLL